MPVTTYETSQTRDHQVECGRCGGGMDLRPSAAQGLAYLVCDQCGHRLAASDDVLRGRAGARVRRPPRDEGWQRIRNRADAWWARLDTDDPWRILDLAPGADLADARRRFHQLACEHHPDKGGDPARMREVLAAWVKVRARLEA